MRSSPRVRAAIVAVATFAFMALTARLGIWQLSRAAQKEALQQAFDTRSHLPPLAIAGLARDEATAAPQQYRPVHLRGSWAPQATVFLDNRQMNGRPGFYVVTPLKLEGGSDAVLVQRGWVPRDAAERTKLPAVPTPTGTVDVVGQIVPPPGRLFDFAGSATSGPIRQNLDLADFSRETGLTLRPLSVLQADAVDVSGDGLLRQWAKPAVDIQKHYGYAFQWFALCALLAGLYVWFQLLRPRLRRNIGRNA
jgi:surfeit locus 1 family protein